MLLLFVVLYSLTLKKSFQTTQPAITLPAVPTSTLSTTAVVETQSSDHSQLQQTSTVTTTITTTVIHTTTQLTLDSEPAAGNLLLSLPQWYYMMVGSLVLCCICSVVALACYICRNPPTKWYISSDDALYELETQKIIKRASSDDLLAKPRAATTKSLSVSGTMGSALGGPFSTVLG